MNKQGFDSTTTNGKIHFQNLLNTLIAYNTDSENNSYNDIHIKQEDNFLIIEWEIIPYDHEWGGEFKFIQEDDVVMKEVYFPDGHYEYILPDEVEDTLKQWHNDNPEWEKNEFGIWVNVEENRKLSIEFNSSRWYSRKVEENDATFSETTINISDNEDKDILNRLDAVPADVLYRTSYIILSPDLAIFPSASQPVHGIIKLPDTTLKFPYSMLGEKKHVETRTFHVYTDLDCDNAVGQVLFLTDTDYLIHRLNIKP